MQQSPTFDDVQFTGQRGVLKLPNGLTVSVLSNGLGYSDEDTYEVAARDAEGNFIRLGEWDDVLGWQTVEQINSLIRSLSLKGQI